MAALVPILVLYLVVATSLWAYTDAKAHWQRGAPVVFTTGSFKVDTPDGWLFGCLLLWILFFPLYLTIRG